jgi:two-component system nitrate/nitrite response regulator NarL
MQRGARTTVYVAEDHPVFREALARSIKAQPRFELVGTAADGRRALEDIRDLRPAVVLLDQMLPSLDGVDVVKAIERDGLPSRVVMLSADSSSTLVYEVVRHGVAGFLTKAATMDEICDAISAAARGETVLAPEIQAGLVAELRTRDDAPPRLLSEREMQVLRLIADGLSGPEIAGRLYISSSTVKTHIKSVFEKLEVKDRAAAVAEAMRRGLLE